jgi:HAD superfamily hydrolase (TIGR01490 family)
MSYTFWGQVRIMKLALFDVDGTITTTDSFYCFLIYVFDPVNVIIGSLVLSPILFGYVSGLLPNWIAKEKVFKYFFKNLNETDFNDISKEFAENKLPLILKNSALEKIKWHLKEGDTVYLVSATIDNYLRPWCEKSGIGLIATNVEIKDKILTGSFISHNCYGKEKVKRIKEVLNLEQFEYIYAYGDSKGDREMLSIADEAFYKFFK